MVSVLSSRKIELHPHLHIHTHPLSRISGAAWRTGRTRGSRETLFSNKITFLHTSHTPATQHKGAPARPRLQKKKKKVVAHGREECMMQ